MSTTVQDQIQVVDEIELDVFLPQTQKTQGSECADVNDGQDQEDTNVSCISSIYNFFIVYTRLAMILIVM